MLLVTCTSCSRAAVMGTASMGSASVAHGSFTFNMVSMWTGVRIGGLSHAKVHVCVMVGRRDHKVSASWQWVCGVYLMLR